MNKKMCRLEDTAGDKKIPKLYKELFAKHQDEKYKAQVIATVIEKCHIFDDAEVTLYPTLVETILKRYWKASDIGKSSASVNAESGLSSFTTVDFTEEDVSLMQQDH